MEHLSEQDLVLLALGEPATATEAGAPAWDHVHACDHCAADLAAFRHVGDLARESAADHGPTPPAASRLWQGIADELGLDDTEGPADGGRPAPVRSADEAPGRSAHRASGSAPRRHRTWLVAASIAAAVILGIGGGVLIGRATVDRPDTASSTTSAELAAVQPAAPSEAVGTATVTASTDGATLTVTTEHLPLQQGFYQVWLYDKAAENMVPVGILDGTGTGSFTLSPAIDIRSFNIVDVSAQELNGNPAHGTSVLQGTLTQ